MWEVRSGSWAVDPRAFSLNASTDWMFKSSGPIPHEAPRETLLAPYEFQTGLTTPAALITERFGGLLAFDGSKWSSFLFATIKAVAVSLSPPPLYFSSSSVMRHRGRISSCFCLFTSVVDCNLTDQRSRAPFCCNDVRGQLRNRTEHVY